MTGTKGGLIKKEKDDRVPVLLEPGTSYVTRAVYEKYGPELFQKLSGVDNIVPVDDDTELEPFSLIINANEKYVAG
jgi:hypothetical protein